MFYHLIVLKSMSLQFPAFNGKKHAERTQTMRDVTWAKEYVLPIQITGKPHWLNEDAAAD